MIFEQKIEKFERRYDARVQDSGYAYDMRINTDFLYTTSIDAYHAKKVKTVSVNMTEHSLYNLLDYLDYCEQSSSRHRSVDSQYDDTPVRRKYYEDIMKARHEEEKLRKQHPALQDAWEQYEAMKILLTK
jgi:hypothetical protein